MGWLEIKQKARDVTHSTFGIPAQFRPAGGVSSDTSARLHYKVRSFGDLDREGYATVTDDVDYVIFDTRDVLAKAGRVPEEGDRVNFPALNRTFKLDVEHPSEDGRYIKWAVTEDSTP